MLNAKDIDLTSFAQTHQVKFGTSGIRGKNSNLTDLVVYVYTLAFIQYLASSGQINQQTTFLLAGDLRANTDHLLDIISLAIASKDYRVEYCGKIPTPALAYECFTSHHPGLMVTGSHIPAHMNGIKFFKPTGELLKTDEQQILAQKITIDYHLFDAHQSLKQKNIKQLIVNDRARNLYIKRYQTFFPAHALANLRIGIYQHSSVARDMLCELLQSFGAQTFTFGRTEDFYGVDTEALAPHDIDIAKDALQEFQLDAIVSTDGDADRPLLSDEHGEWIHGDIIGMLSAIFLHVEHVVMPISCNSSINFYPQFKQIIRTKIGSPYIVHEMQRLIARGHQSVLGYEANGGILLGSDLIHEDKRLPALPTRDSIIGLLTILNYANREKIKLSALVEQYSHVYTVSSSIKDISSEQGNSLLLKLNKENAIHDFFKLTAAIKEIDHLDGLRIYFDNNNVIHLRSSGNAPELRCYTEATTKQKACRLNQKCLAKIKHWLDV